LPSIPGLGVTARLDWLVPGMAAALAGSAGFTSFGHDSNPCLRVGNKDFSIEQPGSHWHFARPDDESALIECPPHHSHRTRLLARLGS
jgi:hypothetical protein